MSNAPICIGGLPTTPRLVTLAELCSFDTPEVAALRIFYRAMSHRPETLATATQTLP